MSHPQCSTSFTEKKPRVHCPTPGSDACFQSSSQVVVECLVHDGVDRSGQSPSSPSLCDTDQEQNSLGSGHKSEKVKYWPLDERPRSSDRVRTKDEEDQGGYPDTRPKIERGNLRFICALAAFFTLGWADGGQSTCCQSLKIEIVLISTVHSSHRHTLTL